VEDNQRLTCDDFLHCHRLLVPNPQVSHNALYVFLTVMPITGVGMGMYGGKGLPFFFKTIEPFEKNGTIAKYSFKVHKTMGTYGKYLVPLHVGAAGMHAAQGGSIFSRISVFRKGM
jgi:1,2-dihydroxy-3-keto-5-methylthiopentene dioxygenase